MQDTNTFERTIVQIGSHIKSLGVPDELFTDDSFRAIYEHPQEFFDVAIELIGRRNLTTHQKRVMGYAMQRLPAEQFVQYIAAAADSVEAGTSDVAVLESTAFAPLNWGRQSLIMRYDQPQVQLLLHRLMNMPRLSAGRRSYIRDSILTGRAKTDYLDYMDMIGHPLRE
jgi:hypothetical protein